jgi:hypothetical protein
MRSETLNPKPLIAQAGNIIVYGILAFAIKYHRNADEAVRKGFWALFLENDQVGFRV